MNDAFTNQVQEFTKQAQDMFQAGKDAKVPENISAFAEDAVAKAREMYQKFATTAQDQVQVAEEVLLTTQAGAKSIGEKMVSNAMANTEAAFEAAQAMARARTFPEIARLQANYFQQQFSVAGLQSKELFELSNKVAKQTMDTVGSAATKTFEQYKPNA